MRASFLKSFVYAAQGIAHSFIVGRNFKVQLAIGALAVALGLAFGISTPEWAVILICIGAVLGGECFNTSIEALVDLVSPDFDELAGHAKDCAAGAVLVFSIASVFVAAVIFIPRLMSMIGW